MDSSYHDDDTRSIPGFPEYVVTRDGRVYSLRWRRIGMRELRQDFTSTGYLKVHIRHNGKSRNMTVHRLVASAFLPPKPTGARLVRHLDGNHLNNHADNLAWGTDQDNMDDRERHGRTARGDRNGTRTHPRDMAIRGEANGSAKLTEPDVRKIRELRSSGLKLLAIAAMYDVTESAISDIALRKTWPHVK